MSRVYKCKCKVCCKALTTDKAFKVKIKDKNIYYCSEDEYKEEQKNIQIKNRCLETIKNILDTPMLTPAILKEIGKIKEYYDYIVIEKCFKEQEKNIKWFLINNEDSNEYGKARYIATIIMNNIQSTKKKHDKELKEIERLFKKETNKVDIEILNIEATREIKREINDISSFLDD